MRALLGELGASAKGYVRGLGLRVLDDVARRGELAGIARRVADLNARLAALEPHGAPSPVPCGVCGGKVHMVGRDLPMVLPAGMPALCTLHRCSRCWALRPVYRLDNGGDAGVS